MIGWFVFLAGVIVFILGVRKLYYGRQASSWPTIEGKLLTCSLESEKTRYGTSWEVKVLYSYSVGGRKFQSNKISFGYETSYAPSYHKAIYKKLHSTSWVLVRYHPDNTGISALVPGVDCETYLLMAVGVWLMSTLYLSYLPRGECGATMTWQGALFFILTLGIIAAGALWECSNKDSNDVLERIQVVP